MFCIHCRLSAITAKNSFTKVRNVFIKLSGVFTRFSQYKEPLVIKTEKLMYKET